MQRTYFLGGASPLGFTTSFWEEHRDCYGYYLKGGPGTGKSTLMKKIAAAFSDENLSWWHCASDPHSLDAVVLVDRRIFIADATAPHEAGTPLPCVTGETVDLAEGLTPAPLRENRGEILRLWQENQAAHRQARKGLAGIAEMEAIIADAGTQALRPEKLRAYAERLGKRLIPKTAGRKGAVLFRQSAALTPAGEIRYLPEAFDLILIHDPLRIAGAMLLKTISEHAAGAGADCEITQALTRPGMPPVMLILPGQRLILAAVTEPGRNGLPEPVSVIRMQRFYDPAVLRKHRALVRFSSKTAAMTQQKVIALLADALQIHDELESYYIRALNPAFLDKKTAALIADIRSR